MNVSENHLASNSLDKNLCNLFIIFFLIWNTYSAFTNTALLDYVKRRYGDFFLSKVLKNDSQRDIKKRIADSNIEFSSFFNSNAWWLQVALVFQKWCFSCFLSCILNAFQISKFVCIAVAAHFLMDQNQTLQQLHDISIMEQWQLALARISTSSNNKSYANSWVWGDARR